MSTVELHVERHGSGTPVVLLHAFPLSSAMWTPLAEQLAGRASLLTPDLRGFGRSPLGDDPPSLDVVADDVAALLDRIRLDQVVLGGLSMGGYAVMSFLRRHPGRVRGVVLADTKATADLEEARANRLRIAGRLEADGTNDVLLEDVVPGLTGETTKEHRAETVARVRDLAAAADPAAAAWAQRAMADRQDSLATLRAVDVPALVLRGDEDGLSTHDDAVAMAEALPRAELVEVPGAGHLTALETPAEVARALTAYLDRLGEPDKPDHPA